MCENACGVCVSRYIPKDVFHTYYKRVPRGLDPGSVTTLHNIIEKKTNNNSRIE